MNRRIYGLENEFGLIYSSSDRTPLPLERILGYLFEGIVSNGWSSNAFLPNGARFYQDTGCHPEYATPECDNVYDLVVHDKAGERILEEALESAQRRLEEEGFSGEIFIYKNNTDSAGNTYGCHENYLIERHVDFWKFSEQLIPFFVSRQVFTGAGKVLKESGKTTYCISQRAQHITQKISCSTTSSRSIINTRDEPHADAEKYRRLHIIVGDANMSEVTTYLKVGTTALILQMIEDGGMVRGLELDDPVKAIRDISRDLTLTKPVKMENGKEYTALEIQKVYLDMVHRYFAHRIRDKFVEDVLARWENMLVRLEEDPMELSAEVDWVIKLALIDSYREKKGCGMDDPRLSMIDLQYHDVRRNRGLYYFLEKEGMVERIGEEKDIKDAMENPPQNTRAKLRGDFIRAANRKHCSYSVDWTYLKLDAYGEETILLMDPFASSDKRVERMIDQLLS
ncbi:MAG: Pup--protein ligase [Nitrospirae bacterium]|nr:Pup--protein ligase [Nitrospirota bacterium]